MPDLAVRVAAEFQVGLLIAIPPEFESKIDGESPLQMAMVIRKSRAGVDTNDN